MLGTGKLNWLLTAVALVAVAGCASGDSGYTEVDPSEPEVADHDHGHEHHDHDHAHDGPHGGTLVELGSEDIHAELVVDESAKRIDVYVLGADAETASPVESAEVSLNFRHGDEVESFTLSAAPQDGDPEGQASVFSTSSEEAFDELHEHTEGATLKIKVGEKIYIGGAIHSHEHGDHEHKDADPSDKSHQHAEDATSGNHPKGDSAKPASDEAATESGTNPEKSKPDAPADADESDDESTEEVN